MLDPTTGGGPYLISGGLSGGSSIRKTAEGMNFWKKGVYTSRFWSAFVRGYILVWAKSLIGTPYGFGCKHPFFKPARPDANVCKEEYGGDHELRLDCSGLVAFAYGMAGFPFFQDLTANHQLQIIGTFSFGSYPNSEQVKNGDINFWCCTQDGYYPEEATHVGIYLTRDSWIAAQGTVLDVYHNTKGWKANFLKHGSVLKY